MDFAALDPALLKELKKEMGISESGEFPPPLYKTIPPEIVRPQLASKSATVIQSFELLRDLLDRHETVIQKRWNKKSKLQKKQILLSAWGSPMALQHRPDYAAIRKETNEERIAGTKYRDAFMWPFINEEDLLRPRTLLLFLNARGRTPPSEFAASDFRAMHLDLVWLALLTVHVDEHVVMFTGRNDAQTYGQMIHWDDHPDAFDWFEPDRGMSPGSALQTLESQERTMTFLVKCAKQILHDIPDESLLTFEKQSPASLPIPSVRDGITSSWGFLAAEAPYRPPKELNFTKIHQLLLAKRDAAADHVRALREDPSYFSDVIRNGLEHRPESLKDTKGRRHPLFRCGQGDVVWGRVIKREIATSGYMLESWTELEYQAGQLAVMQEQYKDVIKPENDLPDDYMDVILRFRYYLEQCAKYASALIRQAFFSSPPMRFMFLAEAEEDLNAPTEPIPKPGVQLVGVESLLVWLLYTLWEDGLNLFFNQRTILVDELQRLIETESKAKSLISDYVADIIGDLSIHSECLRQLETYQPWADTYKYFLTEKREDIEEEYEDTIEPWSQISDALDGQELSLAKWGSPTERRFCYPIDKRFTKDNVAAMRQAEENLEQFWIKLDSMFQQGGGIPDTETEKLLRETRSVQRTPEWVEPATINKNPKRDETLNQPLSELFLDLDLEHRTGQTQPSSEAQMPKPKEKTKGTPTFAQTRNENINPIANENPADPQPTIELDSRSLKVFTTIFYTPSMRGAPGEIPWTDFLHAMVAAGFSAKKLYGSAWQFDPSTLDVERGIQFHEPHPSSKIPYRIARRHGRRLNRAYGWWSGMFRLADKKLKEKQI